MNVRRLLPVVGVAALAAVPVCQAEFYVGASAGESRVEEEVAGVELDREETAWKLFTGARFGLLGVEAGYVDFGNAKESGVEVEVNAFDLFGTLNLGVGPATLFAKAGVVVWEAEAGNGLSVDDDGTDPAYGVGALFRLGNNLGIRAEYERFEVGDVDELSMWSGGIELGF